MINEKSTHRFTKPFNILWWADHLDQRVIARDSEPSSFSLLKNNTTQKIKKKTCKSGSLTASNYRVVALCGFSISTIIFSSLLLCNKKNVIINDCQCAPNQSRQLTYSIFFWVYRQFSRKQHVNRYRKSWKYPSQWKRD